MRVDVQVLVVDILWFRERIDKLFRLAAHYNIVLLRRTSRDLQRWGRTAARGGVAIHAAGLCIWCAFLLFGVEFFGLREAVLEESRGAGPIGSTQASLAGFAGIRREGRGACRVVDAQVVLVPVAAVLAQPGGLQLCMSTVHPWVWGCIQGLDR